MKASVATKKALAFPRSCDLSPLYENENDNSKH